MLILEDLMWLKPLVFDVFFFVLNMLLKMHTFAVF
jgi:hypothetical protein